MQWLIWNRWYKRIQAIKKFAHQPFLTNKLIHAMPASIMMPVYDVKVKWEGVRIIYEDDTTPERKQVSLIWIRLWAHLEYFFCLFVSLGKIAWYFCGIPKIYMSASRKSQLPYTVFQWERSERKKRWSSFSFVFLLHILSASQNRENIFVDTK